MRLSWETARAVAILDHFPVERQAASQDLGVAVDECLSWKPCIKWWGLQNHLLVSSKFDHLDTR